MPNEALRERIASTYPVIRPYIRRTPTIDVDAADFGLAAAPLVLKLELLQHTGSFKTRGAVTNLLTRDVPLAGVVAASGGNHGVAVAYAAHQLGKPARIFVPTVSSPTKMDRIRSYGADLVVTGERYNDALLASQQWAAESGAMPVHAYDQWETLYGAGTTGLEFSEQAPDLDTLLIACGGGGLIGGIAAWYQGACESSASSRIRRPRSFARSKPDVPWIPKPVASRPIRSPPNASASSCSHSRNNGSNASCS